MRIELDVRATLHRSPSQFTMSNLVEELSAQAKRLPREDRARLPEELLDSLREVSEATWEREIERHVAEIDSGAVELIPAEEVRAGYWKARLGDK